MKRSAERVAPVAQTTHPAQAGLARVLNSLVVPPFLRRGNLCDLCGCFVHTFEWLFLFRGIQLHIGEVEFSRVKQS